MNIATFAYPVLLSFAKLSLAMTWPQLIIIGGFFSVACSFDTGHAKIEWYRFSGGKGISICFVESWVTYLEDALLALPGVHLSDSIHSSSLS